MNKFWVSNRPVFATLIATTCGLIGLTPDTFAAESKGSVPTSSTSLGDGIFILGEKDASKYLESNSTIKSRPAAQKAGLQTPKAAVVNRSVNDSLVRFCRANLGRKVGNGQCSELAVLGLPVSGGVLDFNNLWGRNVCKFAAVKGRPTIQLGPAGVFPRNKRKIDVRPGDIIQYENVRFLRTWNGGYSEKSYPHHTSVIARVSKDGQTYTVYEQNVNNTQFVVETSLFMPEMVAGTMNISRPIPRY